MSTCDLVASEVAVRYLRLHLADAVGPVLLGRLIRRFDTIEGILAASVSELCQVEGIGPRRSQAIFQTGRDDAVAQELEKAAEKGVRVICWEDEEYPAQLRHCDDPPVCLYVRGRLEAADAVAIAIVGARKSSRYGYEQAQRFAGLLAGAGFTVVSGMARGIDARAHTGALMASGRTVAVLGSGADVIYPPEHARLAEQILASGALISESPMGSSPTAESFPRRNRIIAGMTLGTIVIEASKRSGALITARLAGEYNREVFAVPGHVDCPTAVGPNELIRKGAAKLVACLEDVLDELGDVGQIMGDSGRDSDLAQISRRETACLDKVEESILSCIGEDDMHVNEIMEETGLLPPTVLAALTGLQLKGFLLALPGDRFTAKRL